jgi:hypothetical protein
MLFWSLAACDALGLQPARQFELVSEWDWMDGQTEFPQVCGSDGTVQYHADGTSNLWGESWTWRLEGEVLTEALADFDPLHVDRSADEIGKEYVSTIQWVDKNTFLKRRADGSELAFRRCLKTN